MATIIASEDACKLYREDKLGYLGHHTCMIGIDRQTGKLVISIPNTLFDALTLDDDILPEKLL